MTTSEEMAERADPARQIRSRTYAIESPSLTMAGNEPVPEEIVRDLLLSEWIASESSGQPKIVVVDENENLDMKRFDWIGVAISEYTEIPVGNRHEHAKVTIPLSLEIWTSQSRQRLWNIMAEVRRILYKWMLALRPYQVIYFDSFRPEYVGPNTFNGTIMIRLEMDAMPIFRRWIDGSAFPSQDPQNFEQNETLGNPVSDE